MRTRATLLTSLALTVGAAHAAQAQPLFQSPMTAGLAEAIDVAAADVNGDGVQDLVAVSYDDDTPILLLRGQAGGPSAAPVEIGAMDADGAYSVRVGDVSGDGRPDVLTGEDGELQVLTQAPDGTFTSAVRSTGANLTDFELADVDGDGDRDVLGVNTDRLNLLMNNGSGTFVASNSVVDGMDPRLIEAGDFDGDGDIDAAGTDGADGVIVMRNAGNGTFSAQPVVDAEPSLAGYIGTLAAGDVDGTPGTDLVATGTGTGYGDVTVLPGGPAGFGAPKDSAAVISDSWDSPETSLGDLDHDGDLDAFVPNYYGTSSLLINNGSGGFVPAPLPFGEGFEGAAIADVDGDGLPDLATTNYDTEQITVLRSARSLVDAPPATATVKEGEATTLTFTRRGSAAATVELAVEAGTADAADLASVPAVAFAPGVRTVTVSIVAVADGVEGDQVLALRPRTSDGTVTLAGGATTISITDGPAPPLAFNTRTAPPPPLATRKLRSIRLSYASVRRRGVPVSFRCRAACTATSSVRFGGRSYGLRSQRGAAGRLVQRHLRLTLKARGRLRAALRRRSSVLLTITTTTDTARYVRSVRVRR